MKSESLTGEWFQKPTGYWTHRRYSIITRYGPEGLEYVLRKQWPHGIGELGVYPGLQLAMEQGYQHSIRPRNQTGPRPGFGGRKTHYQKDYALQAELDGAAWKQLTTIQKRLGCSRSDTVCAIILHGCAVTKADLPPKKARGQAE